MGVLALGALAFSLRAARRKALVDNLPTSKTSGVFIGTVELKGTAESDAPVEGRYSNVACVWFRYTVKERWSREEIETYTDSDGNSKTRMVTKSGWTTIESGESGGDPFYLRDDRGAIRILPKGADVEAKEVLKQTCRRGDALYNACFASEIGDSDGVREFFEEAILLHAPLFLVGHARQRTDMVAAEIAAHDGEDLFLISVHPRAEVSSGLRWRFWGYGAIGFAILAGGLYWKGKLDPAHVPPFNDYVRAGILYAGAWLVGWIWMCFNSLVGLRERVSQGWANIDVELKRRADLLPNIVKLVAAARAHEAAVQQQVSELRSQAAATAPGQPGPDPAAIAAPLRVIVEKYPELKTNGLFLNLQKQLADTEDRIALARGYFNDIATFYNTRIESFPDGFIAMIGGMQRRPLMEAAGFERAPVPLKVSGLQERADARA